MEILLSLALGLSGAIYLKRYKDKSPSIAFYVLMVILACWPILGNIGLYFLAREYQMLFGVWPQPMINDPKHAFEEGHATYDALYNVVDALYGFAFSWMIIFFTLLCTNWVRLSKIWRRASISVCCLSLIAFFLDFGSLFEWMLD